jgi:hypothetical protein
LPSIVVISRQILLKNALRTAPNMPARPPWPLLSICGLLSSPWSHGRLFHHDGTIALFKR